MKGAIIIALVGLATVGYLMTSSSVNPMEEMYAQYMAEYAKSYNSNGEYELRLAIFSENVRKNEEINARETSFQVGINQFTDWTNEEYRKMLGYKRPFDYEQVEREEVVLDGPVANEVDWEAKGAVNKVVNQGNCGSCWAFGTIGAVEGAHFVGTGSLEKFSEQQLVDCCHDSCYGCSGGFQDKAIDYLKTHKLCTEKEYDYKGRDGTCQESTKCKGDSIEVSKRTKVAKNDKSLVSALNIVPVSVTVDAGSYAFQSYSSGVLDSSSCGTQLNHAVLGTGYGDNYIRIKNSWGTSWGDKGYIKIKRTDSKNGICGIYMDNDYVQH